MIIDDNKVDQLFEAAEMMDFRIADVHKDLEKDIDMTASLRIALRVDADILFFQKCFDADEDFLTMLAKCYSTGECLAFHHSDQEKVQDLENLLATFGTTMIRHYLPTAQVCPTSS